VGKIKKKKVKWGGSGIESKVMGKTGEREKANMENMRIRMRQKCSGIH